MDFSDPELQAFEDARSNRALRTDYEGHGEIVVDEKGGARVSANSKHRERVRHEGTAAELARAYVDKHFDELQLKWGRFGIARLVQLVDSARDRGDLETVAEIDAWLMARFKPQVIGADVAFAMSPDDIRRLMG